MVKTTLIPTQSNISIELPQNYIGKKIEVLFYAVDEVVENQQPTKIKMGKLRGKLNLTDEEYNNFQEYVKTSRNEWDNNTIN